MTALDRFIKYISYDTTSCDESETCPSTPNQIVLLRELNSELLSFGISSKIDENGYVYAKIPANKNGLKKLCFIAHVDTSPAVSGKDIKPSIVKCDGNEITLSSGLKITLNDNPELKDLQGEELIITDGTTLLGADDKAGVAEIMTAVEKIVSDKNFLHGDIFIAFTPDEEIGRGMDKFNLDGFDADFGYTIDGGKLGEIEYENFNAAAGLLQINGSSIHPGSAKGKMKNAVDLFCEFHNELPMEMRPVFTEGYEGFFMVDEVKGSVDGLTAKYIIRDHDKQKFEEKKKFFLSIGEKLNKIHGENTFNLTVKDSYYNMAEVVKDHFHLIENAKKAFLEEGVEPIVVPIRGGTDGARLSFMGIPCPNLSTGGFNFHGKKEFIPVGSLNKMVDVIIKIIGIYAK